LELYLNVKSFVPRPSQICRDRALKKLDEPSYFSEPPYKLYWWISTKPWQKTNQFFMSFQIPVDRDVVHDVLNKIFGGGVHVFANGPWYVIELERIHTWREVRRYTDLAIQELIE